MVSGAVALLANCSAPEAMAAALPHLLKSGLPVGAYANGFQQITKEFLKDKATVDARRAPQGIVRAHPPDERPKLAAHLGPPSARSRLPAPIDPEPLTMPAHHCPRGHDTDRLGDPRPKAKDQSEYEAIGPGQSYTLRR